MASACETPQEVKRVIRSKKDAMATYNRLSGVYDLLASGAEWKFIETGIRELAVRDGESVLEIGFGAGRGLLSLAHSVEPHGKVCGVDISKGMIEAARARVRDAHVEPVIELIAGDGSALPFVPGLFDAVFMSFVLELFDNPEIPVVLADSLRVLKKGGRMCVVALSTKGKRGPALRLYEWAHDNFPNYADCRPICVGGFLRVAGFEVVRSEVGSMWGLPVEVVLARKP